MHTHIPTVWKEHAAIVITIHNGSLFESESEQGFAHVCEHLMFMGSSKWTEQQAIDAQHKLSYLEAKTSHGYIQLMAGFELPNTDHAIELLHTMLFDWHCTPELFTSELQDILKERATFLSSVQAQEQQALRDLAEPAIPTAIGSNTSITTLTADDLPLLKDFWMRLLEAAQISVTTFGSLPTQAQDELIERFSAERVHLKPASSATLVQTDDATGLLFDGALTSAHLLLEDILLERLADTPYGLHTLPLGTTSLIGTYHGTDADMKHLKELFSRPVTDQELMDAKEQIQLERRELLDGIRSAKDVIDHYRRLVNLMGPFDVEAVNQTIDQLTLEDLPTIS